MCVFCCNETIALCSTFDVIEYKLASTALLKLRPFGDLEIRLLLFLLLLLQFNYCYDVSRLCAQNVMTTVDSTVLTSRRKERKNDVIGKHH